MNLLDKAYKDDSKQEQELHYLEKRPFVNVLSPHCQLIDGDNAFPPGSNWCFSFAPELVGYSAPRDLHRRAAYSVCESWFLIHQDVNHDLVVCS